jgi:hypothetical protein
MNMSLVATLAFFLGLAGASLALRLALIEPSPREPAERSRAKRGGRKPRLRHGGAAHGTV